MEYIHIELIREACTDIRQTFDKLMSTRILVAKPRARQWCFLRECADALLGDRELQEEEFAGITQVTAAQYKFEVDDKLRRFYQRRGRRWNYVFVLTHKSRLHWYGLDENTYPVVGGYGLLVRDMSEPDSPITPVTGPDFAAYLEKVVAGAMETEFRTYMSLPHIDPTILEHWFIEDSPAYLQVTDVLNGCHRRGWRLDNPLNPSTYRLLSVVVKKVLGNDAEVATSEYWYLRWWDSRKKKYTYPYRETNRQLYILNRTGPEEWKVFQNLRPAPRSSQPFRWKRGG